MSNLGHIHFNTFLIKRLELKDDLAVKDFQTQMRVLATLLMSTSSMIGVSKFVDQMLSVLHQSAVKNNDIEAIAQCEKLALECLRFLDGKKTS